MDKILLSLTILFFCFATIFAQNTKGNLSTPDLTGRPNYSESTPYAPRRFDDDNSKSKKKVKKNSVEKTQSPNALPANVGDASVLKIPVFVHNQNGKPVTDLQSADFKLFIGDKEQEILTFESVRSPFNILLVVDTSPSAAYEPKELQNFVAKFIQTLKPEDKLQIVKFNESVKPLTESTNDRQILKKAIKKIEMGDGTSLYDAISTISQKYTNAVEAPKTIVLLTDGVDTTSIKADYVTSLIQSEKHDAVVFPFYLDNFEEMQKTSKKIPRSIPIPVATGFPNDSRVRNLGISKEEYEIGKTYLVDLAALSGGRTFVAKNFSEINAADIESVLEFLNPQYYISINLDSIENPFERKQVKVQVNRGNLVVRARGSYISNKK
jgi:VWFA-related protein